MEQFPQPAALCKEDSISSSLVSQAEHMIFKGLLVCLTADVLPLFNLFVSYCSSPAF